MSSFLGDFFALECKATVPTSRDYHTGLGSGTNPTTIPVLGVVPDPEGGLRDDTAVVPYGMECRGGPLWPPKRYRVLGVVPDPEGGTGG